MGKIVVIYGLPASGKTTQAKLIADKYGLKLFAMGEKLREQIASDSDLGKKIKTTVDSGLLVSDELIIEVLRDVKQEAIDTGIIFDGFPRIIDQALILEKMLKEVNLEVNAFILLDVNYKETKNRLQKRAQTENRKDDKDKNIIEARINIFRQESITLSKYYQQQNKFYKINGQQDIEIIFKEICNIINIK